MIPGSLKCFDQFLHKSLFFSSPAQFVSAFKRMRWWQIYSFGGVSSFCWIYSISIKTTPDESLQLFKSSTTAAKLLVGQQKHYNMVVTLFFNCLQKWLTCCEEQQAALLVLDAPQRCNWRMRATTIVQIVSSVCHPRTFLPCADFNDLFANHLLIVWYRHNLKELDINLF